jgi:hypothetical protein
MLKSSDNDVSLDSWIIIEIREPYNLPNTKRVIKIWIMFIIPNHYKQSYNSRFIPEQHRHLRYSFETPTFYQNYLAMSNTADLTGGKPIALWSQSISGVNAINPLVALYDIHGRKIEVLFFYFVSVTTSYVYKTYIIIFSLCVSITKACALAVGTLIGWSWWIIISNHA